MKLRKPLGVISVLSLFLLLSGPALAAVVNEIRVANRTDLIYNEISGPGKDASFLDKGEHILQENDLRMKNGDTDGWMSVLNLNVRGTDTDQYDELGLSIEKFDWQVSNKRFKFNAGDYLANFSQYSMNKSIKGGAAEVNFGKKDNYFRAAYGIFDSQWEYLFGSQDREPVDRYGGGFRCQLAGEKYRAGFNFAHVDDRDDDKLRTTEDTYTQSVPAFDWELRPGPIVLSGEHAYSDTDKYDINENHENYNGHAHKVSLKTRRILGTKLRVKWERVSPKFFTIGGGATPDRDKTYAKFDTKLNKQFSFFGVFNHSRNMLSDQSTASYIMRNTTGEAGVKAKKLLGRKRLSVSLSARRKWRDASDDSRQGTSDRVKVSVSDRFFKVLNVKADYEALLDQDNVAERGSQDYFYSLRLSSRHRLADGAWELKPRIEGGIKERENITTGRDDITSEIEGDLAVSYKRLLRFGVSASKIDTDLDDGNCSKKDKQAIYCEIKPSFMKGGKIRLEGSNNDYNFDDWTQDYSEQVAKVQIHFDIEAKGEQKK